MIKLSGKFFKPRPEIVPSIRKTNVKVVGRYPPSFDRPTAAGSPDNTVNVGIAHAVIDDDSMAMSSNFDPG